MSRQWWKAAGVRAIKTVAQTAVALYNLEPDTAICSHAEGHARGIASGHGDPEHLWKGLGLGYTMNGFRQDVKAAMLPKQLYRIRKSWEDAQSQIGAYQSKSVAILMCHPGYNVYDINGALVYSMPGEQEDSADDGGTWTGLASKGSDTICRRPQAAANLLETNAKLHFYGRKMGQHAGRSFNNSCGRSFIRSCACSCRRS